ncbi:MAG: hypothetical protein ATN33_01485 [Epulopiscium sp. Nele67-Bin001]|nr:MAG: hypothetical protein ATN33_01485 [Epulopiscium sp. Nele67-Bin001]
MKMKLGDAKLLLLGALFILVVIYMTITSIALIDNTTASFISDMQGDDIIFQFLDDLELLKDTGDVLASSDVIIKASQNISQGIDVEENAQILMENISNYISIMTNLSFIRSISISNIQEEIIVTDVLFVENYQVLERPWVEEWMLSADRSALTNVYGNDAGDMLTSSVVKFIVDPDTGEALGAVLLNISLEDFIRKLEADYRIADIDIFLEHTNGIIYSFNDEILWTADIGVDFEAHYNSNDFSMLAYSFEDNDIELTLLADLASIKENEYVAQNSEYVVHRILLLTFSITVIILIVLAVLLRPVFSAINSLMNIIAELGEDYPEFTGISQVEVMAKFIEQSLPKKIKYLIYYDELTGLPNRKMFKSLYRTFTNSNSTFVIMLMDIKNFKGINDSCGDEIGDKVLIDIGEKLTSALSGTDGTVVRYSGDEFIIIVNNEQVGNNIGEFFENEIFPKFEEPFIYPDKKPLQISFNSVAILSPLECGSEDDMITKIYVMLRKCKELNTSRLLLFNNAVYSIYVNEERIKASLKGAIEDEEFVVNYQPIVDGNKKVHKAEALIRWFSKDLGFIPPDKFISVAEQTRLIINLGDWIIERVAKDLKTLFERGCPVQISINISPIQIMEDDFVIKAKGIFDKYGIEYNYICFEITESILLEDRGVVKQNIVALKALGIQLALDDFGTGYSSFSYLKEYNLDIIKIDKVFVDNASDKEFAIIDGISRISNALGMQMVLEGIETQDQFDGLQKFGLIQGYYFSKPVIWNEFIKFL